MIKLNTNKLLEELNIKWSNKLCSFCGGKWVVSDKILKLSEYKNQSLIIGEELFQPLVTVTCDNCGNTVLINPLVLNAIIE